MSVVYRVRQFVAALAAGRRPASHAMLATYLQPVEIELFLRQSTPMQHHSLRVFRALEAKGCRDRVALRAALLHDVAKTGAVIRLRHRVISVLVEAVSPALFERLGCERRTSWRYPFYVQAHHADIGSAMTLAAGVSPEVADLIRDHHTALEETERYGMEAERLLLLQWADGAT